MSIYDVLNLVLERARMVKLVLNEFNTSIMGKFVFIYVLLHLVMYYYFIAIQFEHPIVLGLPIIGFLIDFLSSARLRSYFTPLLVLDLCWSLVSLPVFRLVFTDLCLLVVGVFWFVLLVPFDLGLPISWVAVAELCIGIALL